MAAKAEEQHEESLIAQPEDPARDQQDDVDHLEKMTNYKSCTKVTKAINLKSHFFKGLMDIALLTANANQLRHTMELCEPLR